MQRNVLGFTLIEMIVVIMIISILAAAAYIQWPGLSLNLAAQTAQIAGDIRYTQQLSMTKGERFRFVKASANSYQILNSSGTAIPTANGLTTTTLNSGIIFGTFSNLPNNLIVFDGQGKPYTDTGSPGTPLAATATIQLTSTSGTSTISIAPETGRVTTS